MPVRTASTRSYNMIYFHFIWVNSRYTYEEYSYITKYHDTVGHSVFGFHFLYANSARVWFFFLRYFSLKLFLASEPYQYGNFYCRLFCEARVIYTRVYCVTLSIIYYVDLNDSVGNLVSCWVNWHTFFSNFQDYPECIHRRTIVVGNLVKITCTYQST